MGLLEFLKAVVPSGHLVAALKVDRQRDDGTPYTTFKHGVARTHHDFGKKLVEFAGSKKDVYFALAAYKQGWHEVERAGKTKKVLRVRENVDTLKALWFDIDFKDGYADPRAVVEALQVFCLEAGFPGPSILTNSGGGVHAYWPLAKEVSLEQWQPVADALKEAAKQLGLRADLVCTADACRVLRPPGTVNWKDPENPRRVTLIRGTDKVHDIEDLRARLEPYTRKQASTTLSGSVYDEFTGGLGAGAKAEPGHFQEIIKHCAVSKHIAETHGKECSEPEWMLALQLLKHCEDGELWVHAVSDGHPGYDVQATNEKWQQRQENTAGPTLCATFEGYYPEMCRKCPRHGFIKTPLQVGTAETKAVGGMPWGWRANEGVTERLMVDENNQKVWTKMISYEFVNFRTARSRLTGQVEHHLDVPGVIMDLVVPGDCLGNQHKLIEHMAIYGVAFRGKEAHAFKELMATWLKELQKSKHVADVSEQLGWVSKGDQTLGFSCGPTTFYADGRVRNDVRTAKEFQAVAKHYEPVGELNKWKEVAKFLADQNNPAFTALVASAFAAPILRFTGVSGAILSIVSAESGVGKTSALKCAQAVWGSPTHGINAIDDTPKSVARKLGFLNNLPAYWDELRGKSTVEDFLTLAFQVSQGKEKTRLDQSATLRDIHTWETMLIVASNDSIFDAMGQYSVGSDAGVARTFEIVVEPFTTGESRARVAMLFEQLHMNYGHAGRVYAQYLATHEAEVRARVGKIRSSLEASQAERTSERFWFAMMASLIVGAQIARDLGLLPIDVKTMAGYLVQNLQRLRGRSVESMVSSDPSEILATYMQQHQDRILTVDTFPAPRQNTKNYIPQIISSPRTDKIICHVSRDEQLVRVSRTDIMRWLTQRNMPGGTILKKMCVELDGQERRVLLGIGTKYEIPITQRVIEFPINNTAANIDAVIDDAEE